MIVDFKPSGGSCQSDWRMTLMCHFQKFKPRNGEDYFFYKDLQATGQAEALLLQPLLLGGMQAQRDQLQTLS